MAKSFHELLGSDTNKVVVALKLLDQDTFHFGRSNTVSPCTNLDI